MEHILELLKGYSDIVLGANSIFDQRLADLRTRLSAKNSRQEQKK